MSHENCILAPSHQRSTDLATCFMAGLLVLLRVIASFQLQGRLLRPLSHCRLLLLSNRNRAVKPVTLSGGC